MEIAKPEIVLVDEEEKELEFHINTKATFLRILNKIPKLYFIFWSTVCYCNELFLPIFLGIQNPTNFR